MLLFTFQKSAPIAKDAKSNNFLSNFSTISSIGSILFLIFVVFCIVFMSTYGKTLDKGIFGIAIIIIILISFIWVFILGLNQFPEIYNKEFGTTNYNWNNFISRILLVIFTIILFSLIVFWVNNYINNYTGNSVTSIISLIINLILLVTVFVFIYKTINITKPNEKTSTPTSILKMLSDSKSIISIIIVILAILLFSILFKIPNPFGDNNLSSTDNQIEKNVIVFLSFIGIIFFICLFLLPSFKEIKELFSQISGVSYIILYTIFLIAFFSFVPSIIINKLAFIIVPVSIIFAVIIFYMSYSKNLVENFNFTYERIKIMILFFCLIFLFCVYYTLDPGGYIKKYFGYSLLITILLSVFAFIYLLIILTLPSTIKSVEPGKLSSNFLENFSSTSTIGSIVFVIFIIIVTIGISIYKRPANCSTTSTTSIDKPTNAPTNTKASYTCAGRIFNSTTYIADYKEQVFDISTPANQFVTLPYSMDSSYNNTLYIAPLSNTTITKDFNFDYGYGNTKEFCPSGYSPTGKITYEIEPTLKQETLNTSECDNGCLTKPVSSIQPVKGDIVSTVYYLDASSNTGWKSYNIVTKEGEEIKIPYYAATAKGFEIAYYTPDPSLNPISVKLPVVINSDLSKYPGFGYAEIPPTLEIVYQNQTTGCQPESELGFFSNKKLSITVIFVTLIICILWSIVLGSAQFPEVFNNKAIENKLDFFKRSLLALFGIVISGLIIFWIVYNVQHFSGSSASSITSLVLNTLLVLVVLALIYKTINVQLPVGNAGKNAFFSLIINLIFYIPCLLSHGFDNTGQYLTGQYSSTTMGSVLMLVATIILIVLYFKLPFLLNKFILQGGKQLVNDPERTDSLNSLGTYQELNGSDNYEYQYAISFWVYIDAEPPNTNSSYNKFTSLLNFGEKPNILYCGKTNTLMVTMQQEDLQKVTKNKLTDFDENGNRILYVKHDVLLQKWNNIIVNYSGGVLDIFLNGTLVKSDIGVVPYYKIDNLTIGEKNGISGGICNVVYFSQPLNSSNIYILYNMVKDKTPPVLSSSNAKTLQNIQTNISSAKVEKNLPDISNI